MDFGAKRGGLTISIHKILTEDGFHAKQFRFSDENAHIDGVYVPVKNRIFVWGLVANKSHRGKTLVSKVVSEFNCNKITFTPLINNNIAGTMRGEIKIMKADDKLNPFGEDFKYMECVWE